MMLILELCFRFFCCGLFAIGGGLATLPFLYNISKETGWYTFNDISNMIAVSESTPGPMGVNMATYVGFHIKGILGGLAAPLSLVLPSVIIIVIISILITDKRRRVDRDDTRCTLTNRVVIHQFFIRRPMASIDYLFLQHRQHRISAAEGKSSDSGKRQKHIQQFFHFCPLPSVLSLHFYFSGISSIYLLMYHTRIQGA